MAQQAEESKDAKTLRNLEDLAKQVEPILQLAGVASPAIRAFNFVTDLIFRFAKLDLKIQTELKESRDKLDNEVSNEGILYLPIDIDVDWLLDYKFFLEGDAELQFGKNVVNQFKPELRIFGDLTHPEWPRARDTLHLAKLILEEVYYDKRFDKYPLLNSMFRDELQSDSINYRELVKGVEAFSPLLNKKEISRQDIKDAIPPYIKAEINQLKDIQDAAIEDTSNKIQQHVWNTFIGQEGVVEKTIDFFRKMEIEKIDKEIEKLTTRQKALEAKKKRSDKEKKELEWLKGQIKEKTKRKEEWEDDK